MKDFIPILAPPEKPDPWWVRLFSYTVITAIVSAVFAGGLFAVWVFYGSHRSGLNYEARQEQQERMIVPSLQGAAVAGALAGIGYCVWAEWAHRERMAWRRDVRRRSAARGEG